MDATHLSRSLFRLGSGLLLLLLLAQSVVVAAVNSSQCHSRMFAADCRRQPPQRYIERACLYVTSGTDHWQFHQCLHRDNANRFDRTAEKICQPLRHMSCILIWKYFATARDGWNDWRPNGHRFRQNTTRCLIGYQPHRRLIKCWNANVLSGTLRPADRNIHFICSDATHSYSSTIATHYSITIMRSFGLVFHTLVLMG